MKGAARILFVAALLGLGLWFGRALPREVVLVYGLGERAVASVDVEVVRGAEVIRRAELRPGAGPAGAVRHPVRLPDGEYVVRLRVAPREGAPFRVDRPITVSESTTIVLPLQAP